MNWVCSFPFGQSFSWTSPIPLGSSIPLGEISAGEAQEIEFVVSYNGEANPVRLYFTASAWNAKAASVSVGVRAGSADRSGIAKRPPNDDFTAAAVIEGEEGSRSAESVPGDAGAGGAAVHPQARAVRRIGLVRLDGADEWSGPFQHSPAHGISRRAQRSHKHLPRRSNHGAGAGRVRSVGDDILRRERTILSNPGEQLCKRSRPRTCAGHRDPGLPTTISRRPPCLKARMALSRATARAPPWKPASGSGSRRLPPGIGGRRPATACGRSKASTRGASLYSRATALTHCGWFRDTPVRSPYFPLAEGRIIASPSPCPMPTRPAVRTN